MILVTGATGLTGHFVIAELVRRGHRVRALCRTAPAPALAASAEIVRGDLRDADVLARAVRGATGIVHAACTYTERDVDVAAMQALLSGWDAGPFVFLSSLDVYGLAGDGPIDEDAPLCETYDDYSLGKVICERLLTDAADRRGRRDHAMLRAPHIWGPHPTARRRLVPRRLERHEPIVLPGADERDWRRYQDAWIDVRDLAVIVAACVARPPGGPLNVLNGHVAWHDLYRELIRLTGSRSAVIHAPLDSIADDALPNKHIYAQTWSFSEARLALQLGPIPRRSLDVTLRDTVGVDPASTRG